MAAVVAVRVEEDKTPIVVAAATAQQRRDWQ
jgi:hypothetical protein